MITGSTTFRHPSVIRSIVIAGLTVGVLDGLDAVVFFGIRGVPSGRVFQYIASALLGPQVFSGGVPTVVLGVFLHFLVAFVLASIFNVLAGVFPRLLRTPFVAGTTFGLAAYTAMNFLVVPFSRASASTPNVLVLINGILAHIFLVGLPIALIARRSHRESVATMKTSSLTRA